MEAIDIDIVFYDGTCGLCHGWVRFLLRRDREGRRFRYAPLQGETLVARVPEERRRDLPDSVVVLTGEGDLLVESRAVIHLLRRLGGPWRMVAGLLWIVPRPLRDLVYRLVAAVRYRFFRRPQDLCPVVPTELRRLFLP
ncbi:MAG: thiol-disulfide oxidoreductase DCC family protein [Thermoanaerobaculia bacterium]